MSDLQQPDEGQTENGKQMDPPQAGKLPDGPGLNNVTLQQAPTAARRLLVPLAIAVASVCAATALRLVFLQSLGMHAPYITYFPAVMLAAVCGGVCCGLIATALSSTLVVYFWMGPVRLFAAEDHALLLSLWMFIGNGIMISWITSQLHRAKLRAAVAEAEAGYALERETAAGASRQDREKLARLTREQQIVLDTAPVSISLVRERRLVWVNKKTEELFQYRKEELEGQNTRFLYPSQQAYEQLGEQAYPLLARGEIYQTERQLIRRDGSSITVKFLGKAIDPCDGSLDTIWTMEDVSERKQAEEALQKSEERFHSIFREAPMGIALIDSASGRFCEVNRRFTEIVGRSQELLAQSDWTSITHPDEIQEKLDHVLLMHAGGINGFTKNKRCLRPDGSTVWVNMTSAPLAGRAGGAARHLCMIEDVTERRANEDSLRKLSLAVEQSPVTTMITDTKGNIEFVNPMFTQLTGYEKQEVLGKNSRLLKSGELQPETYENMWRTISSGNLWEGEFLNRKKCGELFWEHAKISPITDAQGRITNYLAIKENITSQKTTEELLFRSEERFRQLFDQSNDAIVILGAHDYKIADLNEEAEKVFGYPRAELLGEYIFPLMVGPERSFTEIGEPEKGYWQIDKMSMLKKDGSQLLVSTRFKLITLNDDQALYCSFRDITDRIRIEEEALLAQANMIQADKMASLGLLVSGMAHEINNPNNCVLFNSELLAKTWASASPILDEFYRQNGDFKLGSFRFSESHDIIPRLFSGLVDGAERIRSIVDMLKDFARQDKGDTQAAFDLNK